MRWLLGLAAVCTLAVPAFADQLVAVKPGIVCASADALGRLTLPGGDSRTHLPAPTPGDLRAASAGGCIDITPGLRVTTLETYHNTSVAVVDGVRMTIPNIDFQPAAESASGAPADPLPSGYAVASRVAVEGRTGQALVILEDSRISAQLRERMWHVSADPAFVLPGRSRLAAELARRPLRAARVRIVGADGATLAERLLDEPLAKVARARWHGLPAPTYLLTVDHSIGMGSYAGLSTTLLVPGESGLDPVTYAAPDGHSGILRLGETLKTGWQAVPGRAGGADELEQALCRPDDKGRFTISYETYRTVNGAWQMTSRQEAGYWDNEALPPRSAFP